MPYTEDSKNLMLTALSTILDGLSLHDDAPGSVGANELSGGSPAYAQKTCSFDAVSGGSSALSAAVTFDVPPATTVKYVGLWSGATFRGHYRVPDEAFASQGTYEVVNGTVDLNAIESA